MNAGSSQGTGQKPNKRFVVASPNPPVVEIDTEATAAYVRFGHAKVARTEPFGAAYSLVMVDYDRQNRVVGIEVVGPKEFSIAYLLRDIPMQIDEEALHQTRYVSADLTAKH